MPPPRESLGFRSQPTASIAAIAAALADGPVAVAAILDARGSTPRDAGAFMIVTRYATHGTIGGGEAERRTVAAARALLAAGGDRVTLDFPLGPALDQCCGGSMRVAVAVLREPPGKAPFALWEGGPVVADLPAAPVVVYGAGHVGAALVAALVPLPFALTWIDGRDASVWPVPDGPVPLRRTALPEADAAAAPDAAMHVVMTHSHALDLEIVAAVLARPFRHLGLIGSATKRATFVRRLAARGLDASRMTCPIGVAGVCGKEPAVIAASVAAELLMRR